MSITLYIECEGEDCTQSDDIDVSQESDKTIEYAAGVNGFQFDGYKVLCDDCMAKANEKEFGADA